MKHKRETDEREAMRAMANVIVRIELKRRVIELFGCLFTYSLDRTKQIDRYRSISKYVTIKTAAAVASAVAASVAATAAAAAAVAVSKKKKDYHG